MLQLWPPPGPNLYILMLGVGFLVMTVIASRRNR
jgi:hypothetical protein